MTAPIIGPRTMEQLESQLPAADITLSDEVLDKIDEIVPPGVTVNPSDGAGRTRRWSRRPAAARVATGSRQPAASGRGGRAYGRAGAEPLPPFG